MNGLPVFAAHSHRGTVASLPFLVSIHSTPFRNSYSICPLNVTAAEQLVRVMMPFNIIADLHLLIFSIFSFSDAPIPSTDSVPIRIQILSALHSIHHFRYHSATINLSTPISFSFPLKKTCFFFFLFYGSPLVFGFHFSRFFSVTPSEFY